MTEPVASHNNWLQRLIARWTGAPAGAAGSEAPAPPDLAELTRQVAKLGREQFKLNTLLEAQQAQVQAALDQLREQDARREQAYAECLAHRPTEQAEARLQVVQRLLPVLDGLDEALNSGVRLLERAPSPLQIRAQGQRSSEQRAPWWAVALAAPVVLLRLGCRLNPSGRAPHSDAQADLAADLAAWQDAYLAWLRGLELVRERLIEILALEGVAPIEAVGQTFDPHRHMAMDTAPASADAPPGTIVAELQRGYVAGDRVLRYAQVVVAREPSDMSQRSIDEQDHWH